MKEYLNKNALTLMLGEFFDRFNFYGIQSILLLYLIQNILFSTDKSLTLYGIYSTLGFTLPIVGGYFADRFLSGVQFVLFGIGLILAGNILLLTGIKALLLLGLALIISGVGFLKTNNAVLFGKVYDAEPQKRDAAFTFYYASMNAGAIAGPFVYGTLQVLIGWHFGFLASIIGSIFTIALYCLRFKYLNNIDAFSQAAQKKWHHLRLPVLGAGLFAFTYFWFHFASFFSYFILVSGAFVAAFIAYLVKALPLAERKKALLLMAAMGFGLFFYAMSLQISSSLLLYISHDVNTKVFGWSMPPEYFVSIYPFFVILSAPLIAKIWSSQARTDSRVLIHRVNFSLYLAAISFAIIALSTFARSTGMNWQLIFILIALFVLGAGELSIGPVVTSAVTYLAPEHRQGIYMGLWYLLIGYSAYLSMLMAKMINYATSAWVIGHDIYFEGFMLVTLFALAIAIAMTLLSKRLKNLYPGPPR